MIKEALIEFMENCPSHTSADLQTFVLGFKECEKRLNPDANSNEGKFLSSIDSLKISLSLILGIDITLEQCENILKMQKFLNINSNVNLSIVEIKNYADEIKGNHKS